MEIIFTTMKMLPTVSLHLQLPRVGTTWRAFGWIVNIKEVQLLALNGKLEFLPKIRTSLHKKRRLSMAAGNNASRAYWVAVLPDNLSLHHASDWKHFFSFGFGHYIFTHCLVHNIVRCV